MTFLKMTNHKNKLLGQSGEDLAVQYLSGKGYELLTRNYHSRYGEIDIIVKQEGITVFVEVKTRSDESFCPAIEQIGAVKLERIRKTALDYIQKNPLDNEYRFDIIIIIKQNTLYEVRHYENAF